MRRRPSGIGWDDSKTGDITRTRRHFCPFLFHNHRLDCHRPVTRLSHVSQFLWKQSRVLTMEWWEEEGERANPASDLKKKRKEKKKKKERPRFNYQCDIDLAHFPSSYAAHVTSNLTSNCCDRFLYTSRLTFRLHSAALPCRGCTCSVCLNPFCRSFSEVL